jgi:hypothetical protein
MKSIRIAAIFGLLLMPPAIVRGYEPVPKLPDDGWWVRYHINTKQEHANNERKEFSWTCTFSLVGTANENDEKCRWVEMKYAFRGGEKTRVAKLLIPEKDLLESDQPLDRFVRGWIKNESGNVHVGKSENNMNTTGGLSVYYMAGRDLIIFPGLRRKFEKGDAPKTIEYQQGRLTLTETLSGQIKGKTIMGLGTDKFDRDYQLIIWTDSVMEPGIAAAKVQFKGFRNEVQIYTQNDEWLLQDFGKNAKSELPNLK